MTCSQGQASVVLLGLLELLPRALHGCPSQGPQALRSNLWPWWRDSQDWLYGGCIECVMRGSWAPMEVYILFWIKIACLASIGYIHYIIFQKDSAGMPHALWFCDICLAKTKCKMEPMGLPQDAQRPPLVLVWPASSAQCAASFTPREHTVVTCI